MLETKPSNLTVSSNKVTQNLNIQELSAGVKKILSNEYIQGERMTMYKESETEGWNICQPLELIYYSPKTAPVSVVAYLHKFAKIHLARSLTIWVAQPQENNCLAMTFKLLLLDLSLLLHISSTDFEKSIFSLAWYCNSEGLQKWFWCIS